MHKAAFSLTGRSGDTSNNPPCTVVWQLLLLLLESVGGRLCPVEQVMTCGEKNKQKTAEIRGNMVIVKFVGATNCVMVASCVDVKLD